MKTHSRRTLGITLRTIGFIIIGLFVAYLIYLQGWAILVLASPLGLTPVIGLVLVGIGHHFATNKQ